MKDISIKIGLALAIAIAAIGGTYYWQKVSTNDTHESQYVEYKDVGFTEEEKDKVRQLIGTLQQELDEATNDETRFQSNLQIGIQQYVLGEYGLAKASLEEALSIDENNPVAWGELYIVNLARTDYEAAEVAINKAVSLSAGEPKYWRSKIELADGPLKYSNDAMDKLFEDALAAVGRSAQIHALYAKHLEETGRDSAAIESYQNAIESFPQWTDTYQAEIDRIKAKYK